MTQTFPALAELRSFPQWLVWKYEVRNGMPTKPPYNALTGRLGASNNPDTWCSYEEVEKACSRGKWEGTGWAVTKESGIVPIDLDSCIDLQGNISEWAMQEVRRLNTYTEVSPSGHGLRIFARGTLPTDLNTKLPQFNIPGIKKEAGIEMYAGHGARFVTVTGKHLDGTPETIEERSEELLATYHQYKPKPVVPKQQKPASTPISLSDQELLDKMFASKIGSEIQALWNGTHGLNGSVADYKLLTSLAFWTGKDASRMERLFLQSALGDISRKPKPDYYLQHSIDAAINACSDVYDPQSKIVALGAYVKSPVQAVEEKSFDAIDKSIEDKDIEALYMEASVLAHVDKTKYAIYKKRIKDAFGKGINLNEIDGIIREEKKKIAQEKGENDSRPDLDALSIAFERKHGSDWSYNALTSTWYRWTGTHWQDMQEVEAQKRSCVTLDRLIRNIMVIDSGLPIDRVGDIDGVVRLAATLCQRTFVEKSGVVNFSNGTLDVNTGEMYPHNKDDALTYCLPYAYDEHGEWPTICNYLIETYPDKYARQNYMAHIGLSLMGDVLMHYVCAIIGAPRTGKSVGLDLANMTCGLEPGQYSGKMLFDDDLEGKRVRYTQNRKRIVCVDELPAVALRHEEEFKNMSAHSGVEMRGMCKDDEVKNRWRPKILLAMNDDPEYKDNSGAIKERIVPLLVRERTIPKEQRDIHLKKKLRLELGGFAASCIKLAKAALQRGYYPLSGTMKDKMNALEKSSNPLKTFIAANCAHDPEGFMFVDDFYQLYKVACLESGNSPLSKAKMSNELVGMGIGVRHKNVRNPLKNNMSDRALSGIRMRKNTDDALDTATELDDPMLSVVDVVDTLTMVLEYRLQNEMASQAGAKHNVVDVVDVSANLARMDPPTPLSSSPYNGESQRGVGVYAKDNYCKTSTTSTTNSVTQAVEPSHCVVDVSDVSTTHRLHRLQDRQQQTVNAIESASYKCVDCGAGYAYGALLDMGYSESDGFHCGCLVS